MSTKNLIGSKIFMHDWNSRMALQYLTVSGVLGLVPEPIPPSTAAIRVILRRVLERRLCSGKCRGVYRYVDQTPRGPKVEIRGIS
jgi:hypothetical protein